MATRRAWPTFLAAAVLLTLVTFVGFILIERNISLDEGQTATLHLVRGLVAAGILTAAATYFVHKQTQQIAAQEQKWISFLNGMPAAVFALNPDGSPAFANGAAREMLGQGIVPDVDVDELSTVYSSYIAGTDTPYPAEKMPIVRALAERGTFVASDCEIDQNGERLLIEAWAAPILDGDKLVYSIAVFFGLKDRQEAEREHKAHVEAEAKLEQEQKFRSVQQEFINHAAHQLYTPLTPLRLLTKKLGGVETDVRESIERNIERLHSLISGVLNMAKMQTKANELRIGEENAKQLLEKAVVRMEPLAEECDVTVEIAAADCKLNVDKEQMIDVLVNILDNAIKFSPKGKVTLGATQTGDGTEITIQDDGRGWDGNIDALFEPFQQGNPDESVGWGLGLAHAKTIVTRHNGEITAQSDGVGKGALFTITIPQ